MKGFQLANRNTLSADVVKINSPHFFIRSIIAYLLPGAKKYMPAIFLLSSMHIHAQQNNDAAPDTAYQKMITERTAKIVNTLEITDVTKRKNVQEQIVGQYLRLNRIHDGSKLTVVAIQTKPVSKEEIADAVKKEEENKSEKLKQLHTQFIAELKTTLTGEEIEKVKDGMTYRVLPVTWAAYMEMLPKLTQEQKDKMYAWLEEARELAMDEGSSEKKHAVFGKYKGKINNYLSAEGFNMKKEGEEWAKRRQVAKEAKQTSN